MKENVLAAAELGEEENCNQIDGVLSNTPPKSSVREALRRFQMEEMVRRKAETDRRRETTPEQTRRTQCEGERQQCV